MTTTNHLAAPHDDRADRNLPRVVGQQGFAQGDLHELFVVSN
jgi:hypothetical protein